ncbi:MAG: transposase family protein, partial [Leptolinea sp.]
MESEISAIIGYHFSDLEDPRIERTKLHKLSNILVIAICAIIGCSDNWE